MKAELASEQQATEQGWGFFRQGRLHDAEVVCRQGLTHWPASAPLWLLLAQLADRAKQPDQALQFAERAVRLAPDRPDTWTTLGDLLESTRQYRRAMESYQRALERHPHHAAALNNLAAVYKAWGDIPRAVALMQKALEYTPELQAVRSNLLTTLLYDDRLSETELLEQHRRLAAWWSQAVSPRGQFSNARDPERRLRLGYVSPDLCEHAVMRFFEPLLAAHDRDRFEVFLYSECPIVDAVGERLRGYGNDHWRVTWMRSAAEVAQQIKADQIDLLIDLAGHTRHNRLDILALRPAPVQATYLGYPSVTGLSTIDYRFTDAVLDPATAADSSQEGSEALLRLAGGYACFRPPDEAPEVAPAPSRVRGHVTLGSHHPLLKLNPGVFAAWREILDRLPTTRLILFRSDFTGDLGERVAELVSEHRLPRDRVEIRAVGKSPTEYLQSFADVDLLLDCFPFGGHTMTCEALWMGVPVLTFRGPRPASRLSASVLSVLGLPELIAPTVADYVARAVALAQAPEQLERWRGQLRGLVRERLSASVWIGPYEDALRGVWRAWCQRPAAQTEQVPWPHPPAPAAAPPPPSAPRPSPGPGLAEAQRTAAEWIRLSDRLFAEGRADQALAAAQEAARLEPWVPEHAHQIGNLLTALGRSEEAAQQYRQAVAVSPDFFPGWAMLGQTLHNQGHLDQASEAFGRALAIRPDPKARLIVPTMLPAIYQSAAEVDEFRARFARGAAQAYADGVRVDPTRGAVPNSFLLAYQGGNARDAQWQFAQCIEPPPETRTRKLPAPAADGRLRIGLLSEYLSNHTIGSLWRGFAQHLDRRRFHLTTLSLSPAQDDTAEHFRRHSDQFHRVPLDPSRSWQALRELPLDLLLFPDLGMSCNTLALAALRLAPVQCVSWGHPLTTGLPTIDYFLSGQIYETAAADSHYTERLVRLSGLQTCYSRPTTSPENCRRESFPLPADAHWYGCPQTLFKFHPEFDPLLAEILRRDPRGILILLEGKYAQWTQQLLARWQRVMPDVVARIHFLPALPRDRFVGLSAACDVMLDPLHFGGGNTTLEALAMGTPVVTWPTEFLRARLAQGMLRHIGLDELVADSAPSFVELSVGLATDAQRQAALRRQILERVGGLFDHVESVRAFEPFFEEAIERSRQGGA